MQGPRGEDYSAVYGDLSKDNMDRQETKAGGKALESLTEYFRPFLYRKSVGIAREWFRQSVPARRDIKRFLIQYATREDAQNGFLHDPSQVKKI